MRNVTPIMLTLVGLGLGVFVFMFAALMIGQ